MGCGAIQRYRVSEWERLRYRESWYCLRFRDSSRGRDSEIEGLS